MRLRANHLTISRMLLLPIPCALLFGGDVHKLVALAAFTVLALTDWLDGKIARKQGPTVLGGLLDPIADKMFLAFSWVPLVLIEGVEGSGVAVAPVWVVTLMFFRELSVTGMRSLAAAHGIEFQTAVLAKYKTAFQMAGGGLIFWAVVWQDRPLVTIVGFCCLVAMALGIALFRKLRGRGVGPKVWTQAATYAAALAVVIALPVGWFLDLAVYLILALTLLSGLQYALRVAQGLAKAGWPARADEFALSLAESAIPTSLVALLALPSTPMWTVIAMLTGELATGGLSDLLATRGVSRRRWLAWLRCLGLLVCSLAGWLGPHLGLGMSLLPWSTVAAAGISGFYCVGLFVAHRCVYLR